MSETNNQFSLTRAAAITAGAAKRKFLLSVQLVKATMIKQSRLVVVATVFTASSKQLFVGTGLYALACAPAILVVERLGWPQSFFHVTQFIATLLCFPAACVFLWSTRGSRFGGARWLAVVAGLLSGSWLAFVVYVLLTLDFSGM